MAKARARAAPACAGCGKPMEAGGLLDHSWHATLNTLWARGAGRSRSVDARDMELRIVTAYRCRSCGRLDLYARDLAQPGTPASWKDPPPFE